KFLINALIAAAALAVPVLSFA
ncbi:MAG: hypothetical protein QOF46_316, partial [Paraburkholderia sp.]|nr:hypothetical protein [Paraburkholderia sp.]